MKCEDYNRLLSAYADTKLPDRQYRHVHDHLGQCPRCREDLAEIVKLRSILRALPPAEARTGFWPAAIARAFDAADRRRSARPLVGRLTLAACTIAAVILALLPAPPRPHVSTSETGPGIHLYSLVALHATFRVESPLADSGSLQNAYSQGNITDWSDDHQFDVN